MDGMTSVSPNRISPTVMLVVSMIYGATLGAMGVLSMPGIGLVAVIGGCIVGIGWVMVSVTANRSQTTQDS